MGYNLPDHELFILNRENGISYRKLAEEWNCGQSTIGNHVRQFEELLENGEPKAIALYGVTSMKFKSVPEYIDMIEDMKIEQNDNYTDELNGITDASPEECQAEEEVEQILEADIDELFHPEDMMPVGVREKMSISWYQKLWNWLKWW